MISIRATPPSARRVLAMFAAVLWMLGIELGPGLHVGLHAAWAPHHHGAADERAAHGHEYDHEHAHDHGHEHDHHHDVTAPDPSAPDGASALDLDHGRHAAAHRGVAIQTTAWPSSWIASAPLVSTFERVLAAEALGETQSLCPRARGPPARA